MKKRFFALVCALSLLLGTAPAVSALEGESLRAADALATLSLVKGTGNGDYALESPATRAHAAALLVRLAGKESAVQKYPAATPFRDVPAWCARSVGYAVSQGWITGTSSATYSPNDLLTANAWCTMLLRLLGYSDAAGDFEPATAAMFARRIGLISRIYPDDLTRGDMFQIMLDVLAFSYKDGSGTVIEKLVAAGACSRSAANALGLLQPELTARQIADRCTAAIAGLQLYDSWQDVENEEPSGAGSAFFISADGLAVTCYHCIDQAVYATVTLSTGEVFPVETVVTYDPDIDIAILRVSRVAVDGQTTSAFAWLNVAGKQDVRSGDVVYALGNALDTGLSISSGIISATERDVDRYALPCILNSASISQGSSGGALLNEYGHVIAVTSGAYTFGNDMYLAIPADPILEADLSIPGLTLEEVAKLEAE